MKVLNIDTLAQVKRQIVFKGKTHDVLETSVQQFIDNLKAAEELEEANKAAGKPDAPEKLSKQVENSVKAILDSIPTMDAADLKGAPIEAIGAILQFIRGEMDPEGVATRSTEGTEGDQKKG